MTVKLQKDKTNRKYTGLSADAKPVLTPEDIGDEYYETDTGIKSIWHGASWELPTLDVTIPPIEVGAEAGYAARVDFTNNETIIYKGQAVAGTGDASALWRIQRLTIASDNDVTTEWADGVSTYVKVWDDRLTYTYS